MFHLVCCFLPFLLYAGSYHKAEVHQDLGPSVSVIELYDDVVLVMDGSRSPKQTVNPAVTAEISNHVIRFKATPGREHRGQDRTIYWHERGHFKQIQEIRVYDRATLRAESMHAPGTLRHEGSGRVSIAGVIPLQRLEQTGSGHTALRQVISDDLSMSVQGGELQIEGKTKRLRYRADKKATVDAKGLNANKLWAVGHGDSLSFLMPIEESHVLVGGRAQLVLERKPRYHSELYDQKGAVIYNNLFALNP